MKVGVGPLQKFEPRKSVLKTREFLSVGAYGYWYLTVVIFLTPTVWQPCDTVFW